MGRKPKSWAYICGWSNSQERDCSATVAASCCKFMSVCACDCECLYVLVYEGIYPLGREMYWLIIQVFVITFFRIYKVYVQWVVPLLTGWRDV